MRKGFVSENSFCFIKLVTARTCKCELFFVCLWVFEFGVEDLQLRLERAVGVIPSFPTFGLYVWVIRIIL